MRFPLETVGFFRVPSPPFDACVDKETLLQEHEIILCQFFVLHFVSLTKFSMHNMLLCMYVSYKAPLKLQQAMVGGWMVLIKGT